MSIRSRGANESQSDVLGWAFVATIIFVIELCLTAALMLPGWLRISALLVDLSLHV